MNYTKASPVGIDIPIQKFQTYLYGKLKTAWGISGDTAFDMCGRAYKNQTEDGYTPEIYTGKNEYQDVLFNDKLSALAFFGMKDIVTVDAGTTIADVFLIFMVDLDKLKPSTTERQDEEVRKDVETFCLTEQYGFTVTGFATGIDTVFDQYSGWRKNIGIKYKDQHPLHCFRVNFKLLYSLRGIGC